MNLARVKFLACEAVAFLFAMLTLAVAVPAFAVVFVACRNEPKRRAA